MNLVSRFLTKDDLVSLTGYKRAAEQRRWLVQNGYAFDVRGDGRPTLLWEQVEARNIGTNSRRVLGPNLEALDQIK